jgi:hypothetical protein
VKEQASRLEHNSAGDAATRLRGERLTRFGQRIDGADLRLQLAGIDEMSDLDELGAVRVANKEYCADVVAIGGWG